MVVTVEPGRQSLTAEPGENLLTLLRKNALAPEAPCGGNGKCGKCRVRIGSKQVLACQTAVTENLSVLLPEKAATMFLTAGFEPAVPFDPVAPGYGAAFDVGTTTMVCFLLSPEGDLLAEESMLNPQVPFGADVISRIRCALEGLDLTAVLRRGMAELLTSCCEKVGIAPTMIGVISVAGNPCMQQFFLGLPVDNLAHVPFAPILREPTITPAVNVLPLCPKALLLTVPDIAGYVGGDTMACLLATQLYEEKRTVLLVDIGTNGEMVLIHQGRMAACATAAGPALEGAGIRFGIRGGPGAIDHVTRDGCTVIGGGEARGICGSGLIDAIARMLEDGLLNQRGKILTEDKTYPLADGIFLTQEDIRQVQLAKGAIAAGIDLLAKHLGTDTAHIDRCILAGAFGSFLNPDSACRIGLLPSTLKGRITVGGNLAGSGARMLAKSKRELDRTGILLGQIEAVELAQEPGFRRCFARNMEFEP